MRAFARPTWESEDMGMLIIDKLQSGYGGLPVLKSVSMRIERNESVAIIGANGAGKTTLVRTLCGLLPAVAGRIVMDGVEIQDMPAHKRTGFGIAAVLENRHLFGELTVRKNLALAEAHGARRGIGDRHFGFADVLNLFPFLKTRMDAAVELLSGGEQQMVTIARALMLQPELLILDEPSTGLSPKVVKDIVAIMATLRERGMSILLVEQNVVLAAKTSERAYVMSVGNVVHEVNRGEWDSFLCNEALIRAYLGG